jgi:type I restriction enzyme M protein
MREPIDFDQAVEFIRNSSVANHHTPSPTDNPVEPDFSIAFLENMLGPGSSGDAKPGTPLFDRGARSCVVERGSLLLNPDLTSAESEMRRAIVEHDWLDGVITLPDHLFTDGTAGADAWVLTQRKDKKRRGRVAFVDARELSATLRNPVEVDRLAAARAAIVLMSYLLVDALDLDSDPRVKLIANEKLGYFHMIIDRAMAPMWRMDEPMLRKLVRSASWKKFRDDDAATQCLLKFTELVANRRHGLPIAWPSAEECLADVGGGMGVVTSHEVATSIVKACAVNVRNVSDPLLRTRADVPLPPGYLGLSKLGQREAKKQASKRYLTRQLDGDASASIDDDLTVVGYNIPSAHTLPPIDGGMTRNAA